MLTELKQLYFDFNQRRGTFATIRSFLMIEGTLFRVHDQLGVSLALLSLALSGCNFTSSSAAARSVVALNSSATLDQTPLNGSVSTFAGVRGLGSLTGSVNNRAKVSQVFSLNFDSSGNLYFSEPGMIRKMSPSGVVSTIAGGVYDPASLTAGTRQDGLGGNALFGSTLGVAVDPSGNVIVADRDQSTPSTGVALRKVSPAGSVLTIYPLDSSLGSSSDDLDLVAVDQEGNIFLADVDSSVPQSNMYWMAPNTSFIQMLSLEDANSNPVDIGVVGGLTVDVAGNLMLTDTSHNVVYVTKFSATSLTLQVTKTIGSSAPSTPGNLGGNQPTNVQLLSPTGVAVSDLIFILDSANQVVRQLDVVSNVISTFVGHYSLAVPSVIDGNSSGAYFTNPKSLAVNQLDDIYVADWLTATSSALRGISAAGEVWTKIKAAATPLDGVANIPLSSPVGVTADLSGNFYITDIENQVVLVVDSNGNLSSLAGFFGVSGNTDGIGSLARFGAPYSIVYESGFVYLTDLLNMNIRQVDVNSGQVKTVTFNWSSATGVSPQTINPTTIAVDDSSGSPVFYIGDLSGRIIVASQGSVTNSFYVQSAIALPSGSNPMGLALDNLGNLFVSDSNLNKIFKIDLSTGLYSVFAGGAVGNLNGFGAQARFRGPQGVVVDRFGNVYVADSGNNSIRKINSSGNVSVLAGTASGFTPISGSKDGLGKKASFSNPTGLFLDSLGQLYVADRGNGLIRLVN